MMRLSALPRHSLLYFWRTNLAVVLGAAVAVSVLGGALMVGESVRASLRDLFLGRIGRTDLLVTGPGFFRQELTLHEDAASVIALEGTAAVSRRRVAIQIWGVTDGFFAFHGSAIPAPSGDGLYVSPALAGALVLEPGATLMVRLPKVAAVPPESVFGRRDETTFALRSRVERILPSNELGEFSLRPSQSAVHAVFLPMERLQRELDLPGRANAILIAGAPAEDVTRRLRERFDLADFGLKLRPLSGSFAVESDAGILSDAMAAAIGRAARENRRQSYPVLTYLANTIRAGDRELPYSLVSALALDSVAPREGTILLNHWAAGDLGAKPGETVTLEFYEWRDGGELATGSAEFTMAGTVPVTTPPDARALVPDYPGMTDSPRIAEWDPPFPVDLRRIRPKDEQYWHDYRTTPKAYVSVADGQRLWQTRHGRLTSVRLTPPDNPGEFAATLRAAIDPLDAGFSVLPVREEGLRASRGATDFGEYFVYFSFFLVVSALLLMGLFFRLGVEQRLREIGLLRAAGFPDATVQRLFLAEGLGLAAAGAVLGMAGAAGYAHLLLYGLRTWWVDAVGTTLLRVHIDPALLAAAAGAGLLTALAVVWGTLRGLRGAPPRALLAGVRPATEAVPQVRAARWLAPVSAVLALGLMAAAGKLGLVAAFFGSGLLLLVAALAAMRLKLAAIHGERARSVAALGLRNAAYRPGRSLLCIALIASATFLIVSVEAFRRDTSDPAPGGYTLLAESSLPLYEDPVRLADAEDARTVSFRVKPGEDASCLNLYQPRNPRVIAPPDSFLDEGGFDFQTSLAQTAEERRNPWLLLRRNEPDGAIPTIADANSLAYVLHRKVGETFDLERAGAEPIRLRIVGALRDSVFQRELIVSDAGFRHAFPDRQGYRFFLIAAEPENAASVAERLSAGLADEGFEVVPVAERMAEFYRVENTYLTTFQMLGALGLLLGTAGLGAILLRNVLESRRELALLTAVGYRRSHLARIVVAENALLAAAGVTAGTLCAAIAVLPALLERGSLAPVPPVLGLLAAVMATALLASLAAVAAAARTPLLAALRSE